MVAMQGLVPIALAFVTLGAGVFLLWTAPEPGGIQGRLFAEEPNIICLTIDGQETVNGKLGGELIPGTGATGRHFLTHCDELPPRLLDLDFDVRAILYDVPPAAVPNLTQLLFFGELSYGSDNLLSDDAFVQGDRNLTREIDADPNLGNQDGRVSVAELAMGVNDLPAPGPPQLPTLVTVGITLMAEAGNDVQGDSVNIAFVFQLSDQLHQDLN